MTFAELVEVLRERGEREPELKVFRFMWDESKSSDRSIGWRDMVPDWVRYEAGVA